MGSNRLNVLAQTTPACSCCAIQKERAHAFHRPAQGHRGGSRIGQRVQCLHAHIHVWILAARENHTVGRGYADSRRAADYQAGNCSTGFLNGTNIEIGFRVRQKALIEQLELGVPYNGCDLGFAIHFFLFLRIVKQKEGSGEHR